MAELTKKSRNEIFVLIGLLVILAFAGRSYFYQGAAFVGFQVTDAKFLPLEVTDPALRLDLLSRIRREQYSGVHRNIFSAAPLPPPVQPGKIIPTGQPTVTNPVPVAPPPLVVPATFFGVVTDMNSGKRKAVFSDSQDDVYVVAEGGVLLGQYRVDKIGKNSVDLEEISSGRRTTLTLAPPEDNSQPSQAQL
jgi:hypothetical protein